MWVTKWSLFSLWTFRGHEILERSNRYPGKGCLCERRWRQKINRDIFYLAKGSTTWRKRITAENLSINHIFRMKKEEKGEKKPENSIIPHNFKRHGKMKSNSGKNDRTFSVRKSKTINTSRSRAIHRHKDERNPMENLCQLQLQKVTWEPSQSCSDILTSPVLSKHSSSVFSSAWACSDVCWWLSLGSKGTQWDSQSEDGWEDFSEGW